MAAVVVAMHMQKKKQGKLHHAHSMKNHEGDTSNHTHHDNPMAKEDITCRMQRWFRSKILYNDRLDRKKLAERLYFEKAMVVGLLRLVNQVFVFGLFVSALRYSSNETVKRGIHHNLRDIYGFEDFLEIRSREEFFAETMPTISAQSKQFFVKSSDYFNDFEESGATQLQGDITAFSEPKIGVPFEIKVREFSLTAWVKTSSTFVKGYILQKRPPGSSDPENSCWGWYLHSAFGPQLRYGAQDYYPTDISNKDQQITARLPTNKPVTPDEFTMLTVTVTQTKAKFWSNEKEIGSVDLKIPIAECYNEGQGLFIGSEGLEIGKLRFYPKVLSEKAIFEIFDSGDTLEDISTGSGPRKTEVTELDIVASSLAEAIGVVDSQVSQRQRLSEMGQILNTIETGTSQSSSTVAASSAAQTGVININQTRITGSGSGTRQYYQIYKGPGKLTRTSADADHREFANFPSWAGTGATFTFWYRHDLEAGATGMYLLFAKTASQNGIWSLWLEDNAIWIDNVKGSPTNHYPRPLVDFTYSFRDKMTWRHLALRLDETNDMVTFFIDGEVAWGPTAWNGVVSQVDVGRTEVTFGRQKPGYFYGSPVEVFDFRFYIHNQGQSTPLTDADIKAIAQSDYPEVSSSKCGLPGDEKLEDRGGWSDTFGHTCEWYGLNAVENPALCAYPDAASNCPTACKSGQQCLTTQEFMDDTYFVWDSIQRIEASVQDDNNMGTLCLGSHLTKSAVVQECQNWASGNTATSDPAAAAWLDSWKTTGVSTPRLGKRIDLADCSILNNSIDEFCAFDSEKVKSFTSKMKENGGDYTIGFWTRPTGIASMDNFLGEDRFIPHVNLYSKLSPPTPQAIWGMWSNTNGEARAFTSCLPRTELQFTHFENIEMKRASNEGWTFITLSRQNSSTSTEGFFGDWYGGTNLQVNKEGSRMSQCNFDPDYFFTSLEINYPSLVSPILMVPKKVPFAQMQDLYLSLKGSMDEKLGPLQSAKDRGENAKVNIEKGDFFLRTTLMAPPLLFQTRTKPQSTCGFDYSDKFIQQNFNEVKEAKCADPFVCDPEILSTAELTLACPGELREDSSEMQFGLNVSEFAGKKGFADFLQSVTENPFLYREGGVIPTSSFIDSSTEYAEVTLVFYTPRAGVTTIMVVSADFAGDQTAEVSIALRHYEILEDQELLFYLIVQSLVIGNVFIMALDILYGAKGLFVDFFYEGNLPSVDDILKLLTDLCTATMVVIFIGFRIPMVIASAEKTEEIIGGLSSIPWADQNEEVATKKNLFFEKTKDLLELVEFEYNLSVFCNIILMVSLLRVIQCTSLHPRLALLTGTLKKALDDIGHAALLIGLLMGCFATIATWRFGGERDDFGDLNASMETQFEMMFGEFPEDWNSSWELILFTIFYIMIVFLLVQNFLLAIIVEAYMNVRQDNEDLETEQAFPPDCWESVYSYLQYLLGHWPAPDELAENVDEWNARYSVGFYDLFKTGLFKTQDQCGRYIKYYAKYDFLEPVKIESYAPSSKGNEMIDQIEFRLARRLGKPVPTLRRLLEESEEHTAKKNQDRQARNMERPAMDDAQLELMDAPLKQEKSNGKANGNGHHPGNGLAGANGIKEAEKPSNQATFEGIMAPLPNESAAPPAAPPPLAIPPQSDVKKMLEQQDQAMKVLMHDNAKQRKNIDTILRLLTASEARAAPPSAYYNGSEISNGFTDSRNALNGYSNQAVLGYVGFQNTPQSTTNASPPPENTGEARRASASERANPSVALRMPSGGL